MGALQTSGRQRLLVSQKLPGVQSAELRHSTQYPMPGSQTPGHSLLALHAAVGKHTCSTQRAVPAQSLALSHSTQRPLAALQT